MSPLGDLIIQIFAGLGLFFVGIKLLGRNLRNMAGGPFRTVVQKVSGNLAFASLWGVLAGFITQSGRTTGLILASLVQGGIVNVRMVLPVSLWANLGCTLIVFATLFPIDFFVLFFMGAAGICLAFERPRSLLHFSGAVFGLAIMLYGLKMISVSANGFTDYEWFDSLLQLTNSSLLLALAIGFVLTMAAQSHMGIVLITLAMSRGGFFDFEHAALILLGTHLGSSGITALTGLHFRGIPRQIVISQIAFNLISVGLFLTLFLGERFLNIPLVEGLCGLFFSNLEGQLVAFVLLLNGVTALLLTLLRKPYLRLCERLSPPSEFDHLGRPEFLNKKLLESPSTAIVLADKEQHRLLKRLPGFIDALRVKSEGGVDAIRLDEHHAAFREVADEVHRFQKSLASLSLPTDETERLLKQQNRQELVNSLEETCIRLSEEYEHESSDPEVLQFRGNILEALDTQLLTAIAALEEKDSMETALLLKMTEDGSQSMEGIRRDFLKRAENLSDEDRVHILSVTRFFERATWALHNFAVLLKPETEENSG